MILKKPSINNKILAKKVLLIDQTGTKQGIVDTQEALSLAQQAKLDLVVVSEREDAPVAKIMDFGKYRYEQKKRQKQSSSKPSLKEVKLRPNVGEADYGVRISRALQWLEKGDSVKFQVRLRGREHQHRDRATDLLQRVIEDLSKVSEVQIFDRRALIVQLVPV
ncbi:translation initiation factor IF-3 [Acaryochloris sp. 'Moss Beach']|uniref:translation initiation factor IF-3 n=1 Tax=Acaryochloris TaxID=155977 RepID=UPI001BB08138|nr:MULTISPECIES: translation initiation factor IF-3 [Acaryochloris]QUY45159.1 translation initiation factor IF-3 [Acaryochloris marina S15]UJB72166.1 translation initiation factor IF-3 [Acaryochloris sp. 'Moss Beach']